MSVLASSPRVTPVRLTAAQGRAIIRRHSKSFSLASLLLGAEKRDAAVALYAYCRRADDAIDLAPADQTWSALGRLRAELDDVYAGRALAEPILAEFQRLVFEREIPKEYPGALLEGFQLDAANAQYASVADLYRYCWCVAGSVGAMMCHVLGVGRERAIVHGVHLGMAMQLTNICRDVAEDWQRGRLYIPAELAPGVGQPSSGGAISQRQSQLLAQGVRRLLSEADVFYRSGDLGLPYLSFRGRLAVATARRVYSSIGERILVADANVLAGRAVVSPLEKLWHVLAAGSESVAIALGTPSFRSATIRNAIRFPEDVLPV